MSAALLTLSPDHALLLLTFGVLLVYVELNRPGTIVSGAVGLTAVLLALAVFARLPLDWLSLLLILAAVAVFVRGVRRDTSNLLYVEAILCLIVGFQRLITARGALEVHLWAALSCGLVLGISTAYLSRIARRARRNKGLD